MNLFPYDALGAATRDALWPVILSQGGFVPRFAYTLPPSFSYEKQTLAYDWARESGINIFVSVALKLAIFENEEGAAMFKLWV